MECFIEVVLSGGIEGPAGSGLGDDDVEAVIRVI
jgi:hypothetical protein